LLHGYGGELALREAQAAAVVGVAETLPPCIGMNDEREEQARDHPASGVRSTKIRRVPIASPGFLGDFGYADHCSIFRETGGDSSLTA
jgi:hypothetical protein